MRLLHASAVLTTIVLGSGLAIGQVRPAQCGPGALVITTPNQRQAAAQRTQPTAMPRTTVRRVGRRAYLAYGNRLQVPFIPFADFMRRYREQGGKSSATRMSEPDSGQTLALTGDQLPWSLFEHCGWWLTPVKSQQARGTCHAFAAAALLESLAMARLHMDGLPTDLAELDLSEEWLTYQDMKQYGTKNPNDPNLDGDGGFADDDLNQVANRPCPLEAFWPYDPECWPTATSASDPDRPKYPCGRTYKSTEKCDWHYWAQLQPDEAMPTSITQFRNLASPQGPLPNIQAKNVVSEADADKAMELAKRLIRADHPVVLSLVWPSQRCVSPTGAMYAVVPDYPFAVQAKIAAGQTLTRREQATWDDFYGEGHCVLLFGYGLPGTAAEGVCLVKNSHGLDSGFNGIVYISENLIKLSFPSVQTCDLSDQTLKDLDRFAETMKGSLH